ncbi:MAG: DUF2493 domain-containing protein [Oscillospiraceae bacterium]|nr:DUF2493 domain-containing protein [Oscillospiraceae bacterium]
MKVAIIGSRDLTIDNLENYIPRGTTEIISGGAKGVDACARDYAIAHNIKLTEFLPEYEKYGKNAPLKRNLTIIESADVVLAFWNGKSRGTKFVIEKCRKLGKEIRVKIIAE